MNPEQNNQQQVPIQTPPVPPVPKNNTKKPLNIPGKEALLKLIAKLPPPLQDLINKFYSNKLIFWTITTLFGLMFLIIVLGLLFGSAGNTPAPVKTTKPTPNSITLPSSTPSVNVLQQTQIELSALKDKINSLDIKQSHLKPPPFNFDIKF